jgi:hypothetical protein
MKIRCLVNACITIAVTAFVIPLHAYESPSGGSGWNSNPLFALGDFDSRAANVSVKYLLPVILTGNSTDPFPLSYDRRATLGGAIERTRRIPATDSLFHWANARSDQKLVGGEHFLASTIVVTRDKRASISSKAVLGIMTLDQELVGGECFLASISSTSSGLMLMPINDALVAVGISSLAELSPIPPNGYG